METWLELLTLKDNFTVAFTPDYNKPIQKPKNPTFVSFFNVPSETDEDWLTDFVDQFAVVEGPSSYPKETYYNDIEPKVIHMSPILWTQSPAITNSLIILVKKYALTNQKSLMNTLTMMTTNQQTTALKMNQISRTKINQKTKTVKPINHQMYHKQATIVNNKISQQINKTARKWTKPLMKLIKHRTDQKPKHIISINYKMKKTTTIL